KAKNEEDEIRFELTHSSDQYLAFLTEFEKAKNQNIRDIVMSKYSRILNPQFISLFKSLPQIRRSEFIGIYKTLKGDEAMMSDQEEIDAMQEVGDDEEENAEE